jgi:hypothetical protein
MTSTLASAGTNCAQFGVLVVSISIDSSRRWPDGPDHTAQREAGVARPRLADPDVHRPDERAVVDPHPSGAQPVHHGGVGEVRSPRRVRLRSRA